MTRMEKFKEKRERIAEEIQSYKNCNPDIYERIMNEIYIKYYKSHKPIILLKSDKQQ